MLRFAVLSLAIAICAIWLILLGNIISVAVIAIAKVALWVCIPIFVLCIIIDILQKRSKRKAQNK